MLCSSRKSPGTCTRPPLPSGPEALGFVAPVLVMSARARQRAPVVVVELAGIEMRVRGPVATRGVVAVVVVGGLAVAAEAAVHLRVVRQHVVVPEYHRLAIAHLDQRRRRIRLVAAAVAEGPELVPFLVRPQIVELAAAVHGRQRHDVGLLRQVFLPPLVREPLAGRATFRRTVRVLRIRKVAGRGELGVIGQPLRRELAAVAHEVEEGFSPKLPVLQLDRRLELQPRHLLRERQRRPDRAARDAGDG